MKICILTHTFPRFDGDIAAPFMYGVAKGMVEAGNEVIVVTPFSDKFAWNKKNLSFKIVTYKYIWPNSFHKLGYSETLTNDMGLPILMWVLSPFMYFFALLKVWEIVRREKIEIINAHWILPNGFIAGVVSLFTGVPVVSTLPGSDVYMVQKNGLFNLLGRFAAWKSKWITSNSGQLIVDLEKATNIKMENKSSTIIYGVDPQKFKGNNSQTDKLKKELEIKNKDIVVLGVGRLVAKKGFRYLVEASKIIDKKEKNLVYVIVGDGDERKYLEDLARKLGVYEKFRFVGSIDYKNLIYYYNLADIFILPSVRDEKGNLDDQSVSVIEAMSCGTPVITTDFPGYRSVIDDGRSGYLVKEKDYKKISERIVFLAINKRKRNEMGRIERKEVVEKFSWGAIGVSYTNLFSMLIKKYYSLGVPKILDDKERLRIAKQIWGVLSDKLENTKKLICLDVGSSSGVIDNFLSNYFKKVVAVDIDENAINLAKSKFKKNNLKFILGNIEGLVFKNNSFDVVICNQVYNFVDNPKKMINEIYRVLKPGGICYLGARNKFAFIEPQYDLPFGSWIPSILPFGKNYMSSGELQKLVEKFKIDDYTVKILKNPKKYGFLRLQKYSSIARYFPIGLLYDLVPNYIWILNKN